jgi:hypothetical protein
MDEYLMAAIPVPFCLRMRIIIKKKTLFGYSTVLDVDLVFATFHLNDGWYRAFLPANLNFVIPAKAKLTIDGNYPGGEIHIFDVKVRRRQNRLNIETGIGKNLCNLKI